MIKKKLKLFVVAIVIVFVVWQIILSIEFFGAHLMGGRCLPGSFAKVYVNGSKGCLDGKLCTETFNSYCLPLPLFWMNYTNPEEDKLLLGSGFVWWFY